MTDHASCQNRNQGASAQGPYPNDPNACARSADPPINNILHLLLNCANNKGLVIRNQSLIVYDIQSTPTAGRTCAFDIKDK
jgi:hypothetical protein